MTPSITGSDAAALVALDLQLNRETGARWEHAKIQPSRNPVDLLREAVNTKVTFGDDLPVGPMICMSIAAGVDTVPRGHLIDPRTRADAVGHHLRCHIESALVEDDVGVGVPNADSSAQLDLPVKTLDVNQATHIFSPGRWQSPNR